MRLRRRRSRVRTARGRVPSEPVPLHGVRGGRHRLLFRFLREPRQRRRASVQTRQPLQFFLRNDWRETYRIRSGLYEKN